MPPNITQGQLAFDPVNGIVYYKDENNNTVATTWSWLQNLNQETTISSEKNVSIEQDLTVGGDLIISGDTVSLNVSQVLIEDNILVLNYNVTGSPILNAGIEVERGTSTNVQIRWNESSDKWQFTNDGTTYLDLNSIIANSVTLGLHTVGNYVMNLTAGTGITLSDNTGEGATPTISIGQDISTGATPNFARVVAPLTGNVTGNVTGNLTGAVLGNVTGNVTGNLTGNVTGTVSNISNHGINDLSDVTITSSADGDFLRWTGSAWVNDAVNLTSDTVGDYVKSLVQGNGLTISNNSGEGATPNIAIDTSIVQTRVTNVTDTEIGYLDGVSSAIQTQLDTKAPTASPTFTGTVSGVSKSMVGLGNADDTSDANKPVSTAQQTALDLKANSATPTFTGNVSGITKSMVGLGNVDNTSDVNKPVSTAQQTALDLKANSATPTFTGMVTAPLLTVSGVQIDASGPSDTNVLKYSSALNKYIPGVASTVASLDDLTDVIISAATPNQVLKYDGSNWVNAIAPSGVAGTTYFSTIGNGSTSTFTITHGLSTRDLVVSFTDTASPYSSFSTTWEATTLNAITVYFETAPSSNSVRVSIYAAVSGVALSTDLDSLNDVALSGLANGDFLRYNGSNWINDPVNLSTDTVGDYVSSLVQGTGITITNNSGEGATPTISVTSSTYQPLDGDLTAIAGLAGTSGLLNKTAADTWALDTNAYITSLTVGQLTNVSAATPSNDEVLAWQSSTSQWINKTFSATVATLDIVGDVTVPTPSTGQFLKWDGSAWVNSDVALGANTSGNYVQNLVAGTGIAVTNNSGEGATPTIAVTNLVVTTSDTGTVTDTMLATGVAKAGFRSTLNDQTGTTYTLVLTDLAKLVTLSNAGAITLTVPLNSSVAFAIGDRIDLLQKGAGQVTVAAAGGVTINSTPGLKLRAQWSSATVVKLDTNTWVLIGDLQA